MPLGREANKRRFASWIQIRKRKTTQGSLVTPGSDVVFDWRLSRAHHEANSLLQGFEGILQSDGYGAYESFALKNEAVKRIAAGRMYDASLSRPNQNLRQLCGWYSV